MVNDVNNKPNKKVMQDIFKKLEVCVKKSLDEMEKSSNKKEFLARRNALLDANKKKSRKSLLSRLLDITKGDDEYLQELSIPCTCRCMCLCMHMHTCMLF